MAEDTYDESSKLYGENFAEEEHGNKDDTFENTLQPDLNDQPLEKILCLKDSIGLRVYKTAIGLQDASATKKRKKVFKRENKNFPREMSSKIPVNGFKNIFSVKKKILVDPRFEEGFDEVLPRNRIKAQHRIKQRRRDYSFIDDLRRKQKLELEKRLAEGVLEVEERQQAQKILQKMKSREVSKKQQGLRDEIFEKYSNFLKEAKEAGQKVKYLTTKDKKKAELMNKFNELKRTGRLDKYLEKKRKKNASRDRQKMHSI